MSSSTKTTIHVVAIPLPAQGHVLPMLEALQWLGPHGIKVTFVNTEINHSKVLSGKHNIGDHIDLVSVPDGMEPGEDRTQIGKWMQAMEKVMPVKLEELILKVNRSRTTKHKITCVIADYSLGWALRVGEKLKLRRVIFWPLAAAQMALSLRIPKLMEDGVIDENGTPQKREMIQLSPNMPSMNPSLFGWACLRDPISEKIVFKSFEQNIKDLELAQQIICNSTYELEPAAFDLYPNIIPVGPLLAKNRQGDSSGYFWQEDLTCLEWLDQQEPNSVVYVAFGSFTVFDSTQFQELALGLEMSKKPFLWVVRPDMIEKLDDAFTQGFKERVGNRGRIIGWAPQQRVLSHPSLACFLSHCGWNSTMEGLSNGVPFLCWPYFGDQFINERYIVDIWKVGLGFDRDETWIIRKEEIRGKVEKLFGDSSFKERVMELKDVTARSVSEGGLSSKNFNSFIEWLKKT